MLKRNQEPKRTGRVRLDTLHSNPKLHDVRMLLVEAQRNKGALCELPIKTAQVVFVLSCQSDHLSSEPCWTLYEGEDGSKQIWSYMNEDLEMITDIVNMSITDKTKSDTDPSSAFSDVTNVLSNAIQAQQAQQDESSKPWGQFAQPTEPASPFAQPTPQPTQFTQPSAQPWTGGAAPQQPFADPQQQFMQQPPQQPYMDPQQQYAQQQFMPQQQQQYGQQPQQAQAPSDWPSHAAPAPTANPWLAPQPAAAGTASGSFLKFLTLLQSKKNLTIGELLFESDLPAPCVDSAMRLQEMICKSEITDKAAIEALRIAAERGTGIVDDGVLSEIRMRNTAAAESSRAALTLLKDSGIITESDLNDAESKAMEQGKEIGEMLIASGKTDRLMLDGAVRCLTLISDAKIRPDQAIIALNYCMRARTPVEQAFEDLSIDI